MLFISGSCGLSNCPFFVPVNTFRPLFPSQVVAQGFDFHVQFLADQTFIGGCWVFMIV